MGHPKGTQRLKITFCVRFATYILRNVSLVKFSLSVFVTLLWSFFLI